RASISGPSPASACAIAASSRPTTAPHSMRRLRASAASATAKASTDPSCCRLQRRSLALSPLSLVDAARAGGHNTSLERLPAGLRHPHSVAGRRSGTGTLPRGARRGTLSVLESSHLHG